MIYLLLLLLTTLTTTSSAFAAVAADATTHDIDVGRGGTLTFRPSTLFASVGDTVNFHFFGSNHSVAESTFDKPCRPKSGGVDARSIFSGFSFSVTGDSNDVVASQMWSMRINSTDPVWLYCSQEEHQHCRNGQSMVINPLNDTDMTIEAYMQAASTANVTSPTAVFGGRVVDDDGGQAVDQGSVSFSSAAATATTTATAASSSSTTTSGPMTVMITNGVAPTIVVANVVWEFGLWSLLAVVFIVTL